MYDSDKARRSGGDAALIALGLILAAVAGTVDVPTLVQLLLGVTAAGLLFWVLIGLRVNKIEPRLYYQVEFFRFWSLECFKSPSHTIVSHSELLSGNPRKDRWLSLANTKSSSAANDSVALFPPNFVASV